MRGRGFGRGFQAPGRGRMPQGDKPGSGIGGNCICGSCGYTIPHITAQPCNRITCPKCGAVMTRQ